MNIFPRRHKPELPAIPETLDPERIEDPTATINRMTNERRRLEEEAERYKAMVQKAIREIRGGTTSGA